MGRGMRRLAAVAAALAGLGAMLAGCGGACPKRAVLDAPDPSRPGCAVPPPGDAADR